MNTLFTTITALPPFTIFLIGALLAAFSRGHWQKAILLLTPILSFINLLAFDTGYQLNYQLFDLQLTLVAVDKLSLLFAYLFHLAALIGVIYALHVKDSVQHVAALAYAGSAVGTVMAGDWITLFLFWECLALTSVFLIWARRSERAYSSGMRYLIMQVLSGVLLFAGALILVQQGTDLSLTSLSLDGSQSLWQQTASWLIFIAIGIKCGFPLLHTWITDAYPEATVTGTVFLSAFTTKVAVYTLARCFAGTELLVPIGLTMACFPIFYAVIENDLRRVLTYSMINQIGFMVCGIGIGTELAVNGAVAHAFNDVLFKGVLMMSMGAVLLRTNNINGSDLGGLYKSMPITTVLCIVGAASISAFPLFNGFVSKSIIMAEMLKQGHTIGWLLLLFAAAGVFHHAGIKIPFFAFFAHDSGRRVSEAPINMLLAMGIGAVACVAIGSQTQLLYSLLPYSMDYTPYDATHILTQLQLLCFSALAFVWLNLRGMYPPELRSVNLDADWLYRVPGARLIYAARQGATTLQTLLTRSVLQLGSSVLRGLTRVSQPHGFLARGWGINNMVIIVIALLGAILLFNYQISS